MFPLNASAPNKNELFIVFIKDTFSNFSSIRVFSGIGLPSKTFLRKVNSSSQPCTHQVFFIKLGVSKIE